MFIKSLIYCSIFVLSYYGVNSDLVQANWEPCKYPNGTAIPVKAEDIEVYVTNCTRNEAECRFVRGTTPKLNITFKAKTDSHEIERGIMAKIYMSALSKYVNIPYGPVINACASMRNLNTSATNCLSTGLQMNHIYNSLSDFKVSPDFPEVRNIQVMVLIREKNSNRRVGNLRKWDKHPGPMFACIMLNNCAVV